MSDPKVEEIRRCRRIRDLQTLFRHRDGPILPNDQAGREDLRELLLPVSVGPKINATIRMERKIEVWAPWMSADEATALIDDINRTPIWLRKPTARELGERQGVTNAVRAGLSLWTILPYDMTDEQMAEWRKERDRERKRLARQARGSKPRAESHSQKKPWIKAGMSRRSWYRKHANSSELRGTDSSGLGGADPDAGPLVIFRQQIIDPDGQMYRSLVTPDGREIKFRTEKRLLQNIKRMGLEPVRLAS